MKQLKAGHCNSFSSFFLLTAQKLSALLSGKFYQFAESSMPVSGTHTSNMLLPKNVIVHRGDTVTAVIGLPVWLSLSGWMSTENSWSALFLHTI